MKFTGSVLAVVVGLLLGCSSDETPTVSDSGSDAAFVDVVADVAGDAQVSPGGTILGKVLHYASNTPANGISLSILDATGSVKTAKSAADGAFSVQGVVKPYSILLRDLDNFPTLSWGWDELTANIVVLGVDDPLLAARAVHTVPLSCSIQVPNCTGVSCDLAVAAGTIETANDSIAGGGTKGTYVSAGTQSAAFNVIWLGLSSSRSISVEVLGWDAPSFQYWYGSKAMTVTDGQPNTCGTIVISSVQAPATLLGTITSTNLNSNYFKNSSFTFEMPSGVLLPGRSWDTNSFGAGLPNIGIKSWSLTSTAQDPVTGSTATATTGSKLPTLTTGTVNLYGPPQPITPSLKNASIASTGKIVWADAGGPANYVLRLVRTTDAGALGVNYFTSQTAVALDRLRKLGVNVEPGTFWYQLYAKRPSSGVDALVAGPTPSPMFGAESTSRTDVDFTVTP